MCGWTHTGSKECDKDNIKYRQEQYDRYKSWCINSDPHTGILIIDKD